MERLAVDFSATTGSFRGGATGTLYGLGDIGVPTSALVNGAHITSSSQRAPYGTQHPSGDALRIEDGFFAKHGQELAIYVQDYYPDWPYNGSQRPGDDRTYDLATGQYTAGGNGVWDYLEVVEFVTEAVATQSDHPELYLFIPFNEPDGGNWYPDWSAQRDTFLDDWSATYHKIQEVWDRHGLGHARIGGPGDTRWQPERSYDFLTYTRDRGELPDVFIWHELGIDNLATYRSHFDEYRAMERELGIEPIHVNITEYGMLRDMGVPGQLIQWFSLFEDTKVDAQTAYWNYAGNLSDNTARANGANGGWWMFTWYGDLAGSQTVAVTPPRLNAADSLQGIAAIDAENRRATILYGGADSDVTLDLSGLDPDLFGSQVDVEVREVTLMGAEGLANTPPVVLARDGVALDEGRMTFTVATYDRYAGYQILITPEQDRAVTVSSVWTISAEAESLALSSAQSCYQDPLTGGGWMFPASGSYDVGSFNSVSSRAEWTVTVPRTGMYRLQVVGSAPGAPGRHALFVDDMLQGAIQYTADLAFNDTSMWHYRGSAEATISLTAGTHVLSIRASMDGSTVLPNADITLDKVILTDISDGEPVVYPASGWRLFGGSKLSWAEGTRGSAEIAGAGQRADLYVTAMETGYHDVTFAVSTSAASDMALSLNGRVVCEVVLPGEGTWSVVVRAHLSQGINELELVSHHGAWFESATTTRAAVADGSRLIVEAEDLVLNGVVVLADVADDSGSNVSGGAYVTRVGAGAANTIEIPRPSVIVPGDYDLVVHFSNAEELGHHDYNPQVVNRRIDVTEVDAGIIASGYFRYTYSWQSFLEKTIPLTLITPDGSIVLGNADAAAPDIDKIILAPVVAGEPSVIRKP
ncbi:MAG: hypothetical protein LBM23_08565 [Propionibacteriaceae bacterium]|jgi:hypothetical protein|nr:hypothetical protein [Propionibacteriaceae bacterium]